MRPPAVAGALAIGGCFSPAPHPGLPCADGMACPSPLVCDPVSLTCEQRPGVPDGAAIIDGPPGTPDAPPAIDAALFGWAPPVWLGAAINSAAQDNDPSVTADQLELYFASDRGGGLGGNDLYVSKRLSTASAWPAATAIVELDSTLADASPDISPDGLTIYFVSNRVVGSQDVYVSTRPDRLTAWAAPVVEPALSSPGSDVTITLSADRLIALNDHTATGLDREIYQRTRPAIGSPWTAEVRIAELSSTVVDGGPCLDATNLVVYFKTDRVNGLYDIFRSSRASTTAPFERPVEVVELDSAVSDSNPAITGDERTIYLPSTRPGGEGGMDLWMSTR